MYSVTYTFTSYIVAHNVHHRMQKQCATQIIVKSAIARFVLNHSFQIVGKVSSKSKGGCGIQEHKCTS